MSTYQRRIIALEGALSNVRAQVGFLNAKLEKARQDQSCFVELFENTPAAYVVHDCSGYVIKMNPAAETLLGAKARPGSKTSLGRFFSEESRLRWFEHMRACVASRKLKRSELELRSRDGRVSPVELLTLPGSHLVGRRPSSCYTIIMDRSQRRAVESALVEKQEYYQRLVDMIEAIVWEADAAEQQVTFVSGYAERLLGFPLAEWSRRYFWQNRIFVQDRERVLDAMRQALADRKELQVEYRVVAADRRLVWLHDCIRLVEHHGRPRLRGVAIDITEQRDAEEQLRQAHASLEQRVGERTTELRRSIADLEGFSYSLSHDMRAPIRAMQGYASLVKEMVGEKLGPRPVQYLQRIMQSAERLDLLVQDVLKYSGTSRAPMELKPVPLQSLFEGILHEYPTLQAQRASIQIERPMPSVLGHEAFVGQALSNLLTNAVKFVPKGTSPRVRMWAEGVQRKGAETGDPWVRIWVEDNGLGIAPEDQGRIFRFFERVYPNEQFEGTGMGLAIVQKAVERLGG
ncbi:MAG: PAS domain S-box protein, partial [Limisphaerales bacterium]